MAYLAYLQQARDYFFKEKDALAAEAALKSVLKVPETPEEKRAMFELLGLVYRKQKKYEQAMDAYGQIEDFYGLGYCAMLQGQLLQVQKPWARLAQGRPNHWCVSLYGLITRQLRSYPTLFQVRNHLESDISYLIEANCLDYLQNLLCYIEFLTQINLEAPKFAGRALLNAGFLEQAGPFLMQGQKALPNDPEIYFHLGQYSIAIDRLKEAHLMLKQCLLISPSYRPASELLATIQEVPAS